MVFEVIRCTLTDFDMLALGTSGMGRPFQKPFSGNLLCIACPQIGKSLVWRENTEEGDFVLIEAEN